MEKVKYYTPELEEIGIGFEYSWFSVLSGKRMQRIMSLEDLLNWGPETMEHDLDSGMLQVKYLDQKDIESEGFIIDPSACEHDILNFEIHRNNTIYGITLIDESDVVIYQYAEGREHTLFNGTIKNINELRKLLKQLNIK